MSDYRTWYLCAGQNVAWAIRLAFEAKWGGVLFFLALFVAFYWRAIVLDNRSRAVT